MRHCQVVIPSGGIALRAEFENDDILTSEPVIPSRRSEAEDGRRIPIACAFIARSKGILRRLRGSG